MCPLAGRAPTSSEVSLKAQLECQRQTHVIAGTVKPEHRCPFPVRPSIRPSRPPPSLTQAVTGERALATLTHPVMWKPAAARKSHRAGKMTSFLISLGLRFGGAPTKMETSPLTTLSRSSPTEF